MDAYNSGFSCSGSSDTAITGSPGTLHYNWMPNFYLTCIGSTDRMLSREFRYIYWNPTCSFSPTLPSQAGELVGKFGILLIPTHLPGARNVTADALSRLNSPSPTEWRLPQETLLRLFSGDPSSWHVRHGREQGDPNLHFTLPGRQSFGGQHPLNIVGRLRTSVCLASGSHCPKDPPENQGLSGHHSDSSSIPKPVSSLASPTITTQSTASHSDDQRGSLPVRTQQETAPISQRASPVRPNRVDIIRDILKQHDFPDAVVNMAADPLHNSSSHVYNAQWKASSKWGNDKGIPSKDLSYITLAEYLVHLYLENKQVNTIKAQRATIASVLKMLNPPTVLQEETIHNIIRRMTILRPRTQEVLPRWHLSVVLKCLMKPPFTINGSDRNIPPGVTIL